MLCEAQRCEEAVALYEGAAEVIGQAPLTDFNPAIALEDQQRPADAIGAYGRVLAIDPSFADAHYKLGILLERLGDPKGGLRHFSAYRRLAQGA